jgi:ubiquitin-protein ligase
MALHVKRATKEFQKLSAVAGSADMPGFAAITLLDENDVLKWSVKLRGTAGTLYADGLFDLHVTITAEYPHQPPQLAFVTKMWHPSVAADGRLCEKLVPNWAPTNSVADLIKAVVGLFGDVAGHEVLNDDAAKMFQEDRKLFATTVSQHVGKYAK